MKTSITNPCPENWDNMQDSPQGKFCEICSRCVIDFTEKTNQEIKDIIDQTNGKRICGKISSKSFSKVAASMILITNLTFIQTQINESVKSSTLQTLQDATKVSGRLVSEKNQKVIAGAEVIFVKKEQLIKTTTNENGYFSLVIPNDLLADRNLLYINFDKLNAIIIKKQRSDNDESHGGYGKRSVIFSGDKKFENEKIMIGGAYTLIGEVVVVNDPPPNYYYIDGENVSKEKFEKMRRENPEYQYFYFDDKEAEVIDNNSFIDSLYLLYSK
ncbi:hypothetical protein [Chryseobacterium sp. Hurlbut01]|uniref:hypothetical protein n=1 Tax=Chryseobacterium sp. Hurlbut01 TaxID=1681828 RepID=UPI00067C170B|nr:hypothetical protein [Chryseobacterium sp. Hurlbut01]KNB62987.1 hypothetical protein AC804_02905 [Chryseobacterium sp. Hurlbut01]